MAIDAEQNTEPTGNWVDDASSRRDETYGWRVANLRLMWSLHEADVFLQLRHMPRPTDLHWREIFGVLVNWRHLQNSRPVLYISNYPQIRIRKSNLLQCWYSVDNKRLINVLNQRWTDKDRRHQKFSYYHGLSRTLYKRRVRLLKISRVSTKLRPFPMLRQRHVSAGKRMRQVHFAIHICWLTLGR